MCQLLGMNCNTPTDIVFSFEGSVVVLVLLIAIQMASVSLFLKVVVCVFFAITTLHLNPRLRIV